MEEHMGSCSSSAVTAIDIEKTEIIAARTTQKNLENDFMPNTSFINNIKQLYSIPIQ